MSETKRARKMLLCAAGGYHAFALPSFVLSLLKNFADGVQVVLSPAAAKMTSAYAIEIASRHPVYINIDDRGPDVFVPHIELGRGVALHELGGRGVLGGHVRNDVAVPPALAGARHLP